jgi:hypothetical protein
MANKKLTIRYNIKFEQIMGKNMLFSLNFEQGSHAGIIYSRLYTQQHTAGFTENNWTPHHLRPTLSIQLNATLSIYKVCVYIIPVYPANLKKTQINRKFSHYQSILKLKS